MNLDNILIDEKSFQNISVDNISYKNLISKPLLIRSGKADGFITGYDGTRYLVLFGSEKYDSIYKRIRYLVSVKSGITYTIFHNYPKVKVDSYDSLPLGKKWLHNVIILIKSVFNKNKNNYYYNIFLEKASKEFFVQ